jgi:hypothetical protein
MVPVGFVWRHRQDLHSTNCRILFAYRFVQLFLVARYPNCSTLATRPNLDASISTYQPQHFG